jgi:hypothetical protein
LLKWNSKLKTATVSEVGDNNYDVFFFIMDPDLKKKEITFLYRQAQIKIRCPSLDGITAKRFKTDSILEAVSRVVVC